jgi:hypothetical protein
LKSRSILGKKKSIGNTHSEILNESASENEGNIFTYNITWTIENPSIIDNNKE